MSPKQPAGALRTQLLAFSLCVLISPLASASNVFTNAWECAKGSAEAGYALAGKGAQALDILGKKPLCVGYAASGEPAMYATTGALFTLNAIDSSVVSSSNCVASVKAHAVVPMGKLLDGAFSGVIPANLLDAGSQEAADQLWEFMQYKAPPPVSTAIERIDCGCSFLEAGVSVQNLVEIFTIIAQAGEKCDAMLSDVPGYQAVKKGVQAGAGAMNNLGEDIFTSQVQHKDVEAYYFYDFDGGSNSYAAESHAAARVLDPGHDWRTQEGASALSDTVVKLGGGAINGTQRKQTCINYFDSHKMDEDNAEEVCEAMVQRFDHDYQTLVAHMASQDSLIKQLKAKLESRWKQGRAACDAQFPTQGATFGPAASAHGFCLQEMDRADGRFGWRNPYAVVGGLGEPIDPAIIDAQLATGKTWYFVAPIEMWGAHKIGWEAFENNGGNAGAALATGLLAFDMMRDKALVAAQASYDKQVKMAKEQQEQLVKNAAGFAFPNCPTGAAYQACLAALGEAVQVCVAQTGTVSIKKEFPDATEQAKIAAIEQKCGQGYVGLADALDKRDDQASSMRNSLGAACPGSPAGLRTNCLADVQAAIDNCQGGAPHMSSGYFLSGQFAQDPTPQVGCAPATALFKGKWAADDEQIVRINEASTEALKACIAKVPDSGDCQQKVGELAKSCRVDLQQTANILLGGLPLQSDELGNAKDALAQNADDCIAQMKAIPELLGHGHEAEVLMLSKYGSRCGRNSECTQLLSTTLQQCEGGAGTSTRSASGRTSAGNSGRPTTAAAHSAGARQTVSLHSTKLAGSPTPVVTAMNNPSAFKAGTAVLQLAKTPEQLVADCGDELEAALAKFGHADVPNVASTPAQTKPPVLMTNANVGVVGPARTPTSATRMPSARGPMVTLQPGMDRMGGDFRGFALRNADPQLCRQACADDDACRSYTYVNPGLKGPQAMCFLKNSTPPATPDSCCTSGEKK